MIFELLYAVFWILLLFLGLRSTLIFKNYSDLRKLSGYGFLLKSIAIISLMVVFQNISPDSNLFIDTNAYMRDTAHLNHVFYSSPINYFKFLTGIGETNELVLRYLSETYLWDNGHGLYNDSKNVVRFNSLIYFISGGNVYVHVVFMSLFSTIGLRLVVSAFKKHINAYRTLFFLLLFLLPSIFIATGGVLKEPFLILGVGLFLYAISSEVNAKIKWPFMLFGLLFLVLIKPYVLLTILFGILFMLFSRRILPQKPWLSLLAFSILSAIVFLTITPIRVKAVSFVSRKQMDMERIANGGLYAFENKENPRILYFKIEELHKLEIANDSFQIIAPIVAEKSTMDQWENLHEVKMEPSSEKWKIYAYFPYRANSFYSTTPIRNSLYKFIVSAPEAFINALLRPFPLDPGTAIYKFPAMIEVWFCLGVFIFALFNRKKISLFEKRILGGLIIFIVTLLVLVGFTTPVVGALVRYRIPAFIGIFVVSFIILKIPEKWKNRIQ